MFLVLVYLAESESATSGEVAEVFPFISREYASLLLGRCYDRGLVSRTSYKHGRVHGYIYKLNEKGAEWILHKSSQWKISEERERMLEREVGKESVTLSSRAEHVPAEPHISNVRDFSSTEIHLLLWVVNELLSKYQSLKRQCDLSDILQILAISRISERQNAADYLLLQMLQRDLEHSEGQRLETAPSRVHSSEFGSEMLSHVYERGLINGLEFAKLGNKYLHMAVQLNTKLTEILIQRNSGKSSIYGLPVPLVPIRSLKSSSEDVCLTSPVSKNAIVAGSGHWEADDWSDFNCWWRHLSSEYHS